MEAASFGNYDIIRALHVKSYDLEFSDNNGWTPLMFASFSGDCFAVEFLLEKGANIDAFSNLGATSLIIASDHGKENVVSLLLRRGANVNAKSIHGMTALCYSARKGHTRISELLIESGADVNHEDYLKKTALMYAVLLKDLESNKANHSITNANGDTPIMLASAKGYEEIVNALLSCPDFKINQCNSNDGRSSLMIASQFNQVSIVQLLLKAGANVNAKSKLGDTALHLSIANGCIEVIKILHTYQGIDLSAENDAGFTPLFLCIARQRYEILKMLCDSGIDAKKNNKNGDNAITFSIKHYSLEALQIILQKCQLFSKEKDDYIALARRLSAGHIVSFLQQYEPTEKTAAENIHSSQCLQLPTKNQALPEDVSTTNTSVSFAEDQRCMSGSTENQTTSSDPPCPAIDKSFNLEIDSSKDKPLCFNLNGDCRGATKNCIVGKQNSLTDQKTVKE
nr:ankyrin-3-like [Biomphalaria glabrata]